MKIAWFTPFSRDSAIGRFSRLVAGELARAHHVDIWHPRVNDPYPTALRTLAFSADTPFEAGTLAPYDLAVYNLGDHFPDYRDIWLASQRAPGIVILHDFVMHRFFASYYLEHRGSRREYEAAMARLYGERGRAAAGQAVWETAAVIEFPFFEEALRRAYAVVVHADFLRERAAACFPGPVKKMWLPCGPLPPPAAPRLDIPEGGLLLLTVGRVTPGKRIASVIEALARAPELRSRAVYAIVGPCEDRARKELESLIAAHRLEGAVRIPGHVSEDRLQAYLARADICVDLRFPAMEGGSASLAEAMLHGKPVIVTDTGVYSELPDDCVRKIRPDREPDDLDAALRALALHAEERKALGRRARRFAEREFTAKRYAAGFLELAAEVLRAKPLLKLVDTMGDRMSRMGVPADSALARGIARECFSLFCAKGPLPPEQT